jgi:hypothetical protein
VKLANQEKGTTVKKLIKYGSGLTESSICNGLVLALFSSSLLALSASGGAPGSVDTDLSFNIPIEPGVEAYPGGGTLALGPDQTLYFSAMFPSGKSEANSPREASGCLDTIRTLCCAFARTGPWMKALDHTR